MAKNKEPRDQVVHTRFSKSEKAKILEKAQIYDMDLSTYCRDKTLNGRERSNYYRRKMNTKIVEITKATNELYDYLARTDSDMIPKADLLPLVDNIKKGCNATWKKH